MTNISLGTESAARLENYTLAGERLNIFTYPAPILKAVAKPVVIFNDELRQLCLNMLYTMYKAPGMGLAAPQIGIAERLFVIDISFKREVFINAEGNEEKRLIGFSPLVFINPTFKTLSGETIQQEGCLSLPGIFENVKRAQNIILEYNDWDGGFHTMQAEDLLAVCIQHENDHLNGIVFLERLSLLKKNMLMKKFLKKKSRS